MNISSGAYLHFDKFVTALP